MKTLLIISSCVLLSSIVSATELSWVDEQIEAIKPPRKSSKISSIKNPFIFLEKNGYVKPEPKPEELKVIVSKTNADGTVTTIIKKKKLTYNLNAIMNSSALINGKWYKKNDKVYSYTLVKIGKAQVTLKKGDKMKTLSTNSKQNTLKFKNK